MLPAGHSSGELRYAIFRLLVATGLAVLAVTQILNTDTPDFAQDYAAAWAHWHGRSVNAPTRELLDECWPEHGYHQLQQVRQPHPPFATLLALPLALLPFAAARLLWCGLSVVAIVAAWQLVRTDLVTCLATVPIWCIALVLGTHEPLLFVMIALAIVLLPRAPLLVGVTIGLSIALKAYPVVLLAGLLIARRWRSVYAATATVILVCAASELVLGIGTTSAWLRYTSENTAHYVQSTQNSSLVRFVYSVVAFPPAAIALVLTAALIWPLRSKIQASNPLRPLLPVALLVSPISWRHYMGLTGLLELGRFEQACLLLAGTLALLASMKITEPVPELFVQFPLVAVLLVLWAKSVLRDNVT
ncbi:MAG: glycosyltransferase family 87 protein [Pirellulales bacterium]